MGIDKAFDKRIRVTEEQKAKTVQNWQRTGMSYTQLGEWCKDKFGLEKLYPMLCCARGRNQKRGISCLSSLRLRLPQQNFQQKQIIFLIIQKLKMNYSNGSEDMSKDKL